MQAFAILILTQIRTETWFESNFPRFDPLNNIICWQTSPRFSLISTTILGILLYCGFKVLFICSLLVSRTFARADKRSLLPYLDRILVEPCSPLSVIKPISSASAKLAHRVDVHIMLSLYPGSNFPNFNVAADRPLKTTEH